MNKNDRIRVLMSAYNILIQPISDSTKNESLCSYSKKDIIRLIGEIKETLNQDGVTITRNKM